VPEPSVVGPVLLRLPPDPALSRVLRLAASGIAGMAGEHGGGEPIEVEFAIEDDAFKVRGGTAVTSFDTEHPDLILCRTVLAGVCTSHGIEMVDHQAHIWAAVAYASTT
jgi:hypothetical protein